jgi:hypothetical protein
MEESMNVKQAENSGNRYRELSLLYANGVPPAKSTHKSEPKIKKIKKSKRHKPTALEALQAVPFTLRIDFLKHNMVGPRVSVNQTKSVRGDFEKNKHRLMKIKGDCYACRLNPAVLRHHVRPICNGGGNGKDNLVRLCEPCHEELHPWLKVKKVASQDSVTPEPIAQN